MPCLKGPKEAQKNACGATGNFAPRGARAWHRFAISLDAPPPGMCWAAWWSSIRANTRRRALPSAQKQPKRPPERQPRTSPPAVRVGGASVWFLFLYQLWGCIGQLRGPQSARTGSDSRSHQPKSSQNPRPGANRELRAPRVEWVGPPCVFSCWPTTRHEWGRYTTLESRREASNDDVVRSRVARGSLRDFDADTRCLGVLVERGSVIFGGLGVCMHATRA